MKLKQGLVILLALTLTLMGSSALAIPVSLGTQPITVPATSVADGSVVELTLQDFHLLGTDAKGDYLVYVNQNYFTIAPLNMSPVLAMLPADTISSLPSLSNMVSVSYGSKGASVQRLQAALQTLGYLNGAVDGDFGRGTEGALVAFQAAIGAKENGIADPMQQMLAISLASPAQGTGGGQSGGLTGVVMQVLDNMTGNGTQPVPAEAQPVPAETQPASTEAQFASIADRVLVDMQPIYNAGLVFDYDDMVGIGLISDGTVLTYDLSEGTDIDRYQLTLQFGLLARDQEDGTVSIDPAVSVSCACVHRPIMSEVIVKSDATRGTAPVDNLSSTLNGVTSVESGFAILNDQMVAALINSVETGELKVRVNGRYHSFDVQVDSAYISSISKIGVIAQQIKAK